MAGACGTYRGENTKAPRVLVGYLGKEATWNTCSIILNRNFNELYFSVFKK
jgi:hypothetical protein